MNIHILKYNHANLLRLCRLDQEDANGRSEATPWSACSHWLPLSAMAFVPGGLGARVRLCPVKAAQLSSGLNKI
jgi:hypothetical protein